MSTIFTFQQLMGGCNPENLGKLTATSPENHLFGREHRLPNLHFGGSKCYPRFWGYSFICRWFWLFNHNKNGGEKKKNATNSNCCNPWICPIRLSSFHQFPYPPPPHLLMVLIKIQLHRLFQNTITSRVVVYLVGPMSSAESWELGQKRWRTGCFVRASGWSTAALNYKVSIFNQNSLQAWRTILEFQCHFYSKFSDAKSCYPPRQNLGSLWCAWSHCSRGRLRWKPRQSKQVLATGSCQCFSVYT